MENCKIWYFQILFQELCNYNRYTSGQYLAEQKTINKEAILGHIIFFFKEQNLFLSHYKQPFFIAEK